MWRLMAALAVALMLMLIPALAGDARAGGGGSG